MDTSRGGGGGGGGGGGNEVCLTILTLCRFGFGILFIGILYAILILLKTSFYINS